jgi:integrase
MPKVTVPKEDRRLIEAVDVQRMMDAAPNGRDRAIIALYYIFGVRRDEPLEMRKEDIWMDERWLYLKVKREKVPKRMVMPRIDTLKVSKETPFLCHLILHWAEIKPGELLFAYHSNPKTASHHVYMMIKKLNPNVWIHLFRHTRAERFRALGYSDAELMSWFGWTDPRTPAHYVHPSTKTIEDMGRSIE